ncbi:hypothetical protein ACQEU3_05470 [Spirillospora sp. CA-253888]
MSSKPFPIGDQLIDYAGVVLSPLAPVTADDHVLTGERKQAQKGNNR